jgi:hypothetical protein
LLTERWDETREEQRSHVVGATPQHRPFQIMNGLEIKPVRDSGDAINEYVLGHGVAVRQSEAMELRERSGCSLDRHLPV